MSRTCRSCHSGLNVAKRLLFEHVEHRAAQPSVPQAYDERLVVQQRAARDVHHDRRARQQIQPLRRQQACGVRTSAARPARLRRGAAAPSSSASSDTTRSNPGGGPSSDRRRSPVQRAPSAVSRSSDGLSDPADSDDQRPHGIHLAQHRVEAHERRLVPLRAALLVDRVVESAQKMEHAGHDVLRDRYGVDARGVGEPRRWRPSRDTIAVPTPAAAECTQRRFGAPRRRAARGMPKPK